MHTTRLNTVKNKFDSVSNNPLMETTKNLENLQADLKVEQSNNNNYISQNSSLSSQLSVAQNNLNSTQTNFNTLQVNLAAQQNLVKKTHSYLSDYQVSNVATQLVNNEELVKKLIGDLDQLSLE